MNNRATLCAAAALAVTLTANATPIDTADGPDTVPATPITIMTRNVYVGADVFRVLNADPIFIVPTIAEVYATVEQTNFAERAQVLADEVALFQPHLIGLQEAALVRRQSPGDVLFGNPISATDIDMDFLQMYLDALGERGLNYTVAASVNNADIELPLLTDDSLDDIRLTDRDVILVRSDVIVQETQAANFTDNVEFEISGVLLDYLRGYAAATVTIDGRDFRFVNTHLETGGQAEIQAAQAAELVDVLASETLPLIVVGDFNASPESPPERAYGRIAAAGFADVWNNRSIDDTDPGLTCCFNETLTDDEPALTSRIDVLWVRNQPNTALEDVEATVIGANASMQTASGLWPSDHAGVVATLRVLGPGDDGDGDGVLDGVDNCVTRVNPLQRDSD
ncbi:MAG: endonuclease/exonuclease/phosphatase family protein, partial [Gammaproteobacteria bacterium]